MSPRIDATDLSLRTPQRASGYAAGPALAAVLTGGATLARGHSGAGVRELQTLLNQLGAQPPLAVDGLLGPKTEAALQRLQSGLGLPASGTLDAPTLAMATVLGARRSSSQQAPAASDGLDPTRRGSGETPRAPRLDEERPAGTIPARDLARTPATTPTTPSTTGDLGAASGIPDRIIDRTARFESGRRYDAWNPDDNGHGVSFGLIQFNQRAGTLPTLVSRMAQADPQRFDEIFGPHAQDMRNPAFVRSANLNDPDLKARLQQAGREPAFQQVQRDLARTGYYEPAARMAERYGLQSERAHAMLFDSSVQNGVGGTEGFLRQAAAGGGSEREILERFAGLADRGAAGGRRSRILNDASFSDAPAGTAAGTAAAPIPAAGTTPTTTTAAGTIPTTTTAADTTPAASSADAGAIDPADAAPTAATARTSGPLGPGNRVLMIGDSHTVGTYGNEMDRLLRSSGATVSSYGSSGSSPSWWMRGTTTSSGFVGRHADGTTERPADWRTPHATPKLRELIERERPDTLVVSLGGNMRGMSDEQIQRQVRELGEVARDNGVRLVWAGPPARRQDSGDRSSIDRFDAVMREAVAPYGTYVASSRYTEYAGADGVHYSGARGNEIARGWAAGVFGEIQGQ